ncbi:hypothetical protein JK361_33390 [Streptomyces sp. 5-8]|uniref:Resolvase/invertase-type recombinase catalytic domain-containing protein n=1 Tax=Streptomyces musisoli TaxID=2802280 RepID=A0ABS1PBI3_9ACTN|nr:hypothetical protein [Streptomyces musisoli]MBL1109420.1 hypothetical protein [Streptomyces musisoli]
MSTSLAPAARTARLDALRQDYMDEAIAAVTRHDRAVRVAPYVLAPPGAERHADLELIARYAAAAGWQVARSSFADTGQPLPLAERPGFTAACQYAAQGYADGVLAIARPAITTDDDSYARVLEHLHNHGVFLAFLPAQREATP